MKKLVVALSTLAITSLSAQTLEILPGWQLLGAASDINASTSFANSCIDIVWKFDSVAKKWSAYSPKSSIQTALRSQNLGPFTLIEEGKGFWLKANSACSIDTTPTPNLYDLLVGKTYYIPVTDVPNKHVETLQFKNDGHTLVDIWLEDGKTYQSTFTYSIEDNVLHITGEGLENGIKVPIDTHLTFSKIDKNKYIQFTDESGNSSRLYFNKEDAQQALSSTSHTNFKFSTDYLNGKTLYFVKLDDFGYDGHKKWNMARMQFGNDTFTWKEYDTPDTKAHTFHYTIDENDNIVYYYDNPNEKSRISDPVLAHEYIKVCDEGNCNTYLFFNKYKARLFRNQKNAQLATNDPTKKFTYDMIRGKNFYVATDFTLEHFTARFDNSDNVAFLDSDEIDGNYSYSIDEHGRLHIDAGDDGVQFVFLDRTGEYIEAIHTNTPSSFEDDTSWFESTYHISVSTFDNNVTKLKDWFLAHGLWETSITTNGKILKYGENAYDGFWFIHDNIFYFAYPDGDALDFKAYKIENDRLLKQTDAPYSETIRFYYDRTKRDDWLNTLD